jgi:hypothetical protein
VARPGRNLSRREVLRLGGGFALGSAVLSLTGCGHGNPTGATATPGSDEGDVQTFRTYPELRPAAIKIGTSSNLQAPGLIMMDSHFGPGQQGPIVLDGNGDLVWFNPLSESGQPLRAFNLKAQSYKGQPVLSWWQGKVVSGHGEGSYEIASPSYSQVARVEAGNGYMGDLHEFFLTPQGTAFFSCYGTSHTDLSSLGGPKDATYFYGIAQEVDVATGKVLFQWNSDDHVAFTESYAPVPKDASTPWDYFHINSICLSDDGDLLISGRHTWGVYKVSRATGEVLWRMGGKKSDFTFAPGASYAWQHDVTQQPDGTITVFDNGTGLYVTQPDSRGLVLSLDTSAHEVNLVHQYPHPGNALRSGALGSVQVLPDGHVFMGWGVHAWFTEFGLDGKAVLDGNLAGSATQSYRAFRYPWTGSPSEPPQAAAERTGAGMTVFAAWNGATEVHSWLVLAGTHPHALEQVTSAVKAGFETPIPVTTWSPYVSVVALDLSGGQLGRSATIQV